MTRTSAIQILAALILGFSLGSLVPDPPKKAPEAGAPAEGTTPPATTAAPTGGLTIPDPKASLFYFPFGMDDPSPDAVAIGRAILRDLDGDASGCTEALATLDRVEPVENFGGEYPTLRWVCEYRRADDAGKAAMRAQSADGDRLLRLLEPDYARLRAYLGFKYRLPGAGMPGPEMHAFDELVRFNSPGRPAWEHTDDVMKLVGLQPGQAVADIGAGPGFYTFRFADAVGPTGKVYAVEVEPGHLAYLRRVKGEEKRENLEVVEGATTTTGLAPDSVDVIFLCSTYQTIYGSFRAADREAWIASLKAALRPGGRLVISDNTPDGEVGGAPVYRGITISSRLVAGQLEGYGFKKVTEERFVPQRYLLVFEEG